MRRRQYSPLDSVTDYESSTTDGRHGGASWLGITLIFASFLFFALVLIGITLSLTIVSPEARIVIPTFATPAPMTTANTSATTTAATTTVASTITVAPTTVPVLPNVTIVCPPNFTQALGMPLDPPPLFPTVSGNCSSAPLIVQYFDGIEETFTFRRSSNPREVGVGATLKADRVKRFGEHILYSEMLGYDEEPTLVHLSEMDEMDVRTKLRSPSFNSPNFVQQGSVLTYPVTNITSDTVMAVNDQFVVSYTGRGLILVTNKTTNVLMASFFSQSLAPMGTACSDSLTNFTFSENQVVWDFDAQRWLFFQMSSAGGICIHISSSNNTNPTSSLYTTYFYEMPIQSRLVAGLWGRAYVLTFLASGEESDKSKLCALERATLLNPSLLAVNQTAVMFCTFAFENNAPHTWVPVATALDIRPSQDIETSNSPSATQRAGAVFMRVVDDEFYRNGSSPTVDQIEVEHWFNINFTTATFNSIRYPILMADFNDRWNATAATPVSGINLAVQKGLWKAVGFARNNTLALSFASSNATVFWAHLRWQKPNLATAERWDLVQQGNISNAFSPAIQMDANGTIVLAFERSSNITYPSMFITSRLANDPLNSMRQDALLSAGFSGSLFTNGATWSRSNAIAASNAEPRTFFVGGLVSSMPPQAAFLRTYRVRILGEVVERTWLVTDSGCAGRNATCTQFIRTQ